MYIESDKGRIRAELRSPDASSNPYLVYALLIHAGLYGIRNNLSLPMEEKGDGILLPSSRKEAAKLAGKSEFVHAVVPEELIREYIR